MEDILQHIVAGNGMGFETSLDFNLFWKIVFGCITILELVLLHKPEIKFATISMVLCFIRFIPSLIHSFVVILTLTSFGDVLSIDISAFGYLLLLVCVISIICNYINRKKLLLYQKNIQSH